MDEGFHLFFELGAAFSPGNGFPMDAGGRMSQKGADALRHVWTQDMFKLAGFLLHLVFGHLKDLQEKPLGQAMTPDEFPGLFLSLFFQNHPTSFHLEQAVPNHHPENRFGLAVPCILQELIEIGDTFFSAGSR